MSLFVSRPRRSPLQDWCDAVAEFIADEMPEGTTYSLEADPHNETVRVTLELQGVKAKGDIAYGWTGFQLGMFAVRDALMQKMLP